MNNVISKLSHTYTITKTYRVLLTDKIHSNITHIMAVPGATVKTDNWQRVRANNQDIKSAYTCTDIVVNFIKYSRCFVLFRSWTYSLPLLCFVYSFHTTSLQFSSCKPKSLDSNSNTQSHQRRLSKLYQSSESSILSLSVLVFKVLMLLSLFCSWYVRHVHTLGTSVSGYVW